MKQTNDEHAAGVVEARLGRDAHDVIEGTIVLEAWAGRPARDAMTTARELVRVGGPAARARGRVDASDESRPAVVAEGVALVLSILSVAAWATPLSRALGANVLAYAIRVALPVAVALQWGLRSRFLCRRDGLALLARDGLHLALPLFAIVVAALALIPGWGMTAALCVAVWVAGSVMTTRGWAMLYAILLVASAVALGEGAPAYLTLGCLSAATVVLALAAVISRRAASDERPGGGARAATALVIGGCVGVMLVADPTLGWGVHGVHPAVALIPSVIGSFWGGYYLWNIYRVVPSGLSGVPLDHASRIGITDPAMAVFLGAVARLVGATVALSFLVGELGRWTHGTDSLSVFVAFGAVALVSMLVGLLESLGRQGAALLAAAAGLGTELLWPHVVHWHVPGAALTAGALVAAGLTLGPLVVLLARSGRLLATTLWIQ